MHRKYGSIILNDSNNLGTDWCFIFLLSSFYLSVISKFSKINLVILHTKKIVKVFFGVLLKFLFI